MSAASPLIGIVTITFRDGRLSVEPEKIEVPLGGFVMWRALSGFHDPIVVDIIFHGSPFTHGHFRELIMPKQVSKIESGPADEPGEYKYDVRVTTTNGDHLADDDPYVIVRRYW